MKWVQVLQSKENWQKGELVGCLGAMIEHWRWVLLTEGSGGRKSLMKEQVTLVAEKFSR
jgi:hypothetical protein